MWALPLGRGWESERDTWESILQPLWSVMERPAHTTYKHTLYFLQFWGMKPNRRIIWLNDLLTYHIPKYVFIFKNISTLATEVSVCSPLVAKRSDANALSFDLSSCQLWKSDTLLLTGMKGTESFHTPLPWLPGSSEVGLCSTNVFSMLFLQSWYFSFLFLNFIDCIVTFYFHVNGP